MRGDIPQPRSGVPENYFPAAESDAAKPLEDSTSGSPFPIPDCPRERMWAVASI